MNSCLGTCDGSIYQRHCPQIFKHVPLLEKNRKLLTTDDFEGSGRLMKLEKV